MVIKMSILDLIIDSKKKKKIYKLDFLFSASARLSWQQYSSDAWLIWEFTDKLYWSKYTLNFTLVFSDLPRQWEEVLIDILE